MVSIPRLESCCCGCTLRTGTLILLYLYLISAILAPFGNPQVKDSSGKSSTPDVPPAAKIPSAIIGIIISVCGLYGVYTERQGFLLPYLILDAIVVICVIIIGIFLLVTTVILGVIVLLFSILPIYFWLVVYNHYRELEEGKRSSSAA